MLLFIPADSDEEMDELAQEEEQEALALQKLMAASLEEQDFDADIFEVNILCVFVSNKSKKLLVMCILNQPLHALFIEIISLVKCYTKLVGEWCFSCALVVGLHSGVVHIVCTVHR